ncbi:MAG: hypothetical protein B0D92_03050 [Spirochaeta sp. LUC14_002_19_P3]|nr:MAG: hypothetical protein B0D92_03050 [Spirochaeta sp. LUC14_002_19_P3]
MVLFLMLSTGLFADGVSDVSGASLFPWWGWLLLLFGFCFLLGILAAAAGIGGGILYLPIVGTLFPFHLDYVRGASLITALVGTLSAAPRLLSCGLASLRLALPLALLSSIGSLLGANFGLSLPGSFLQLGISAIIFAVIAVLIFNKQTDSPDTVPDPLAKHLGISGSFIESSSGIAIHWSVHRLKTGMAIFFVIGCLSGLFGIGAGWANVLVLNLLLGAPLKIAAATSILVIAINGSAAAWVYFAQGAVLPVIAVPSALGMMLGSRLGVKFLEKANSSVIRRLIMVLLTAAGVRFLFSGLRGV